ncbi:MAG: hypothetical protein F6K28_50700 [Microcoleus sp. SIO2G3]|nr:hypothetical protein [Microcoleus sp. SIO2G3]
MLLARSIESFAQQPLLSTSSQQRQSLSSQRNLKSYGRPHKGVARQNNIVHLNAKLAFRASLVKAAIAPLSYATA